MKNLEAIAVRIEETILLICSLYLPSDVVLEENELEILINQIPNPSIIFVDFNGHHFSWGSQKIDARGRKIKNFIDNSNLALLNNRSMTRFNTYNATFSAIDLTMCTLNLVTQLDWQVFDSLHYSDYFPLIIKNKNHNPTTQIHYSFTKTESKKSKLGRICITFVIIFVKPAVSLFGIKCIDKKGH